MNQLPTPKSFDSPSPKDCKDQDEQHPPPPPPTQQQQHIYIQETPEERLYRISKLLEAMSIADVDAVNNRDWSPSSALFKNKATYWEASTTAALSVRKLSVQGFVDSIKKKVAMSPDFKLRIIDFTTTVDEGKGRAEIFANMEVTGDWSGVAQRNVTHLEYHLIDGRWLHVSHRTMPGMDPMSLSFE
ncbi:hypothetical protein AC578_6351 [Pseudocercospora eumusae]|uniref:SnoaL-like domain-containing protein n=1 Tax=Pseudocercospora eumusae TaxID=321146 RepID=A0A139HGG9_9PEZI|nr:hypothetical protein AC578_6351 [Pseudocercospora eumusae]